MLSFGDFLICHRLDSRPKFTRPYRHNGARARPGTTFSELPGSEYPHEGLSFTSLSGYVFPEQNNPYRTLQQVMNGFSFVRNEFEMLCNMGPDPLHHQDRTRHPTDLGPFHCIPRAK